MSETLETVTKKKPEPTAEQVAAEELVRRPREQSLSLTCAENLVHGPTGRLAIPAARP